MISEQELLELRNQYGYSEWAIADDIDLPIIKRENNNDNDYLMNLGSTLVSYITLKPNEQDYDESFIATLRNILEKLGISELEAYKKCSIDRKAFSKMKHIDHQVTKQSVIKFIFGLRLSYNDAMDLIESSGWCLRYNQKLDILISRYLADECYDRDDFNKSLQVNGLKEINFTGY